MRTETRRQRHDNKIKNAKTYPVEICTINFQIEENVAFVVRSASCFGASVVNVIGSLPAHKYLAGRSGTSQDLVKINQFKSPHDFLEYARVNDILLISADLDDEAVSIHDYEFPLNKRICVVVGHETMGIPAEISMNSDKVYIPMPGKNFCLNTSQAANIFLYEIAKKYESC